MAQAGGKVDKGSHLEVAVIGSGIVGLILGIGLAKRGIRVAVFEQAAGFREIGAGVAFTANAIRCMGLIDGRVVEAVRAVATPNGDPDSPTDYLQWVDGFHDNGGLLFRLDCGHRGFEGCHRAHFLEELAKRSDSDLVRFGKRLVSLSESTESENVRLIFQDNTTVAAQAVIGCDGIKSRVRQLLLGADSPAAHPHFSHKVAFRALVPMDKAERALGKHRARRQHMHIGPGAHLLHFPVAGQALMNVVAFVDEPGSWPPEHSQSMVAPATRQEVEAAFADWGPTVRSLVGLLPPELDKWAIFDTYDHPLPTYARGRVCLAGDAAHASAPHHGAGAGIGIEDTLALCTLLEMTFSRNRGTSSDVNIEHALAVYSSVRRGRSQWLVKSSREVCDIYEWRHPETGTDMDKCLAEITERSHKLWYFNIDEMLTQLQQRYNSC